MQLFYCPDITGNVYVLPEEESGHCVRVLRKGDGDSIDIVDGKGGLYHAVISDAHPKHCTVNITGKEEGFGRLPYNLHIAIAPTKNIERLEWFLEKSAEIGISEISIILTEHCERKSIKYDRLHKVLVSAMKQSLKAYLPKLNDLRSFDDFMETDFGRTSKFIAHCNEGYEKKHLKNVVARDMVVMIGPEGDFSPREADLAMSKGFVPVSLGDTRLRTETAAVYVTALASVQDALMK